MLLQGRQWQIQKSSFKVLKVWLWRNGTSCNVKEFDGICTVGICKKLCNLAAPICWSKMQGHLRYQERLWMWISRYPESAAGEFNFDCYPTELTHFASFCHEHDWLKKIQRKRRVLAALHQLCISESWKKTKQKQHWSILKRRFVLEPLWATMNMSVGDQCRSWVLGPMPQWPGEHWVVLFNFRWFGNRLEILGFALTVQWPLSHIFTMRSTMAGRSTIEFANWVAVLGFKIALKRFQ